MSKTKELTTLGLFLALGIVLPYATGHAMGIPGTILLPMHIPVLLIGFLYGPCIGLGLGVMIPFLSFLFTGMPGALMLPVMLVELGLYGFMSGLLYKKYQWNVYVSLLCTMVAGRFGYLLTVYVLGDLLGLAAFGQVASVLTAVATGLPGIILQIVLVPALVKILKKHLFSKEKTQGVV